jgi:hypothetical protein
MWGERLNIRPPIVDSLSIGLGEVSAYGLAHAGWITRHGLPSHAEAAALRQCYGLPTTSTAEWNTIYVGHILPAMEAREGAGLALVPKGNGGGVMASPRK